MTKPEPLFLDGVEIKPGMALYTIGPWRGRSSDERPKPWDIEVYKVKVHAASTMQLTLGSNRRWRGRDIVHILAKSDAIKKHLQRAQWDVEDAECALKQARANLAWTSMGAHGPEALAAFEEGAGTSEPKDPLVET